MKTTDSMQCLTDAELLRFAEDPLKIENAEIANHIYNCDDCAARFLATLEELHLIEAESPGEPEEEEPFDFQEFWRARKQKDMWLEVASLLEQGQARRQMENGGFFWNWNPGLTPLNNAAATSTPSVKTEKPQVDLAPVPQEQQADQIVLAFISRDNKNDWLFWQALLTIRTTADPEEEMSLVVTDNDDKKIAKGKLLLLGQVLSVRDGQARITLRDFQKGLKNSRVAFLFDSGEIVPGEISILKRGELA